MSDAELDVRTLAVIKEVHNQGAALYNSGDPVAAFRLYEGCLRACKGLLGHRPAVQQRIGDGLAEVERSDGGRVRAFRLHELMEEVRADLKATRLPEVAPAPPSTVMSKLDLPPDLRAKPGADQGERS